MKKIKAHDGEVSAIYANNRAVLSGGNDHKVRLWTHRLEPGAVFDMIGFGANPIIRGLSLSRDGTTVLLGTFGSDIFEISAIDGSDMRGGPIASGHSAIGCGGLSICKPRQEICTVGDDGTLRIWDLNSHILLKMAKFDAQLKCVCYSPSGDLIAIGMGPRAFAEEDSTEEFQSCGAYSILSEQDLSVVHHAKDSLYGS